MVFSPAIHRIRMRYYRAFASGANGELGRTASATRMTEVVGTA
jgi:hypothetical protein